MCTARLMQVKITHLLVSKASQSRCFRYAFMIYMYYSIFHKGLFSLVVFFTTCAICIAIYGLFKCWVYFPRQTGTPPPPQTLFEDFNFAVLKMKKKLCLGLHSFQKCTQWRSGHERKEMVREESTNGIRTLWKDPWHCGIGTHWERSSSENAVIWNEGRSYALQILMVEFKM